MQAGEPTLTSRQLMARAGISRATLNNYIALGILPKPEVATASRGGRTIPRIGHFPAAAVDVVYRVNELKREGFTMAEIVSIVQSGTSAEPRPDAAPAADPRRGQAEGAPGNRGLRLTLDHVDQPAYMVNGRFELEWANDKAQADILGLEVKLSSDITERNIFSLFFQGGTVAQADSRDDILKLHMAIAKKRMPRTALLALDGDVDGADMDGLTRLYDEVEAETKGMGSIVRSTVNVAPRGQAPKWYDVYVSFFREGVFFVYTPAEDDKDALMNLLARRDIVIRDLLKKRRPYLTEVAVLVADLQDSMKICAELPPEEYFQLINDIWAAMEPKLRGFYATHGKHVGDGMLYYFLPQPDCSYALNAIRCAHEMQATMREISRVWRAKKNWLNELRLNIGLHEGQEWFGTYQTPTHIEFTVLGDTVNMAGRLSDFARQGSTWVSKAMLGKLSSKERQQVRYGIRRTGADGSEILVPETFSRVSNLVDLNDAKNHKFNDIAVLPVTEVLDVEPVQKKA